MRARRNNEKHFGCAMAMPPLAHRGEGSSFNIAESEVARWLCSQPSIMQLVFDMVSHATIDGSPVIVYDSKSNVWHGSQMPGGES